jgi:hypothetical protein
MKVATDEETEAWHAELEARGGLRRGQGEIPEELWEPVLGPLPGTPLSQIIIEERRSGR